MPPAPGPSLAQPEWCADIHRLRQGGVGAQYWSVYTNVANMQQDHSLRTFHELGARYMTLTHWDNVEWADAATDRTEHDGLTGFGEAVVREMNQLGMFVDLSHVSADTMRDALRVNHIRKVAGVDHIGIGADFFDAGTTSMVPGLTTSAATRTCSRSCFGAATARRTWRRSPGGTTCARCGRWSGRRVSRRGPRTPSRSGRWPWPS